MTRRLHSINVVLDLDFREDDAAVIMAAIRQFRHVISVRGNVSDCNSHMAEERARTSLKKKIYEVLD